MRIIAAALIGTLALSLASCGGGGSTGSAPVPSPAPGLSTTAAGSASVSYHASEPVKLGPVAPGITATVLIPPATLSLGAVDVTLTSALPNGVPSPAAARRLVKSIGAGGITALGYITLAAGAGTTTAQPSFAFYGNPTLSFGLPASLVTPSTTAYLGAYDPQVGWFVAAPGQPLAPSMTFVPTAGGPLLSAGAGYAYALFVAGGPVAAPSPSPTPTPPPLFTALVFNPAVVKLGGLAPSPCASSPPVGTLCGPGYNAFPVDPGTPAAAVRFFPLSGAGGTYSATVADVTVAAVTQPFLDFDGTELFGVTPLADGATSIRVSGPNGVSATLPVFVTSLSITVDASRVQAFSSPLSLAVDYPNGGSLQLFGPPQRYQQPGPQIPAGAVTTVLDVPAYLATGTTTNAADSLSPQYSFTAASAVSAGIGSFDPLATRVPVTIVDGRANTVTVVVTPPPKS